MGLNEIWFIIFVIVIVRRTDRFDRGVVDAAQGARFSGLCGIRRDDRPAIDLRRDWLFPNLLISTTDPAFNLTIYNASSAPNTLTVMLVIALIGMPIVLLYTTGVYYFFRGKTQLDTHSY